MTEATLDHESRNPSRASRRALDVLNVVLADVRDGLGPYLAIFLATKHWVPSRIGIAMPSVGAATVLAQTHPGALIDGTRRKRSWMAASAALVALGAVAMARVPTLPVILTAQAAIGAASAVFAPAIAAVSLGLVGHARLARRTGRNEAFNHAGNVAASRLAETWGRRPTFLLGFAVLPVRGLLSTLTDDPKLLVAVQLLDGIGARIFGVVGVLVIADLTRGTGRFNLMQGALATATGLGSSASLILTGAIVLRAGFNAGFLALSAVALAALGFYGLAMPETKPGRGGRGDNPDPLALDLSPQV